MDAPGRKTHGRISDRHRLALLHSAHTRLRCQAMEIAYQEIRGESPPNEASLAEDERVARLGLARKWDALRDEIRAAMADAAAWTSISRLVLEPSSETVVANQPEPSRLGEPSVRSAEA